MSAPGLSLASKSSAMMLTRAEPTTAASAMPAVFAPVEKSVFEMLQKAQNSRAHVASGFCLISDYLLILT